MHPHALRVLVVDDDTLVRRSLCEVLSFEGYSCVCACDGEEALEKLRQESYDVVISDMKMPKMTGLELLRQIKSKYPGVAVIMVTGFGSIENAVEAMREGALNYITKPIIDDEIKMVIHHIAQERRIMDENRYLRQKLSSSIRTQYSGIIGGNFRMQKIYDLIDVLAETQTTVLITGESGTGKRMVACAIHQRTFEGESRPFIEVSCGALPETLLESELFGHVKGAFTGAIKDRMGRFESAEGGTIFLDEIDAFTPALQVKLLRVLQDGEYERVGETKTRKANVRIIAATNQNLEESIQKGKFRNDLYYRLNIIAIEIPPLRDRKDDIPVLVEHFIAKHSKLLNKQVRGISKDAMGKLMDYHWPGNVRELENAMERACVLSRGHLVESQHLPESVLYAKGNGVAAVPVEQPSCEPCGTRRLKDALKDPEKNLILEALAKTNWNKKEAAQQLGINRTTLYKKMSHYGISSGGQDER